MAGMLLYLLYLLMKHLVIGVYTVPSNSMMGTIWPGDRIVVEKLSLGPRIAWGDKLFRLPEVSKIDRGDIITFNFPEGDTVLTNNPTANYYEVISYKKNMALAANSSGKTFLPLQYRVPYVKRCIGLPGDTIQINNGKVNVFTENKELEIRKLYQFYSQILSYNDIAQLIDAPHSRVLKKRNGIFLSLSNRECKRLMSIEGVDSVCRRFDKVNYVRKFPSKKMKRQILRRQDNYGPLLVPAKGDRIALNEHDLAIYKRVIEVYEGKQLEQHSDSVFINGKFSQSYTFEQDYFFVMGDNRSFTVDSRNWGLVPVDHIIGRAFMVGWSTESEDSMQDNTRWERLFKLLK